MTQPTPIDYDSAPSPPGPGGRESVSPGTVIAWCAIVVCLIVVLTVRWHLRQNLPALRSPAAGELGFRLMARSAVGIQVLSQRLDPSVTPSTQPAGSAGSLAQLRQAAASPQQRIRIVPVIAELAGAQAASEELDRLREANLSDDISDFTEADPDAAQDIAALETIYTHGPDALDDPQRARLVERHRWFGKLALSWGRAPNDPLRREALAPAIRTIIVAFLGLLAGAAGLVTGIVLLVLAITFTSLGRLQPQIRPVSRNAGWLVEAFALYLAWYLGASLLVRGLRGGSSAMISMGMILAALAPLACLWPLVRGLSFGELRGVLGWYAPGGVLREIGAGILGYLAGLPVMAIGIAITWLLARYARAQPSHPVIEMISSDFWRVLWLLALASLYAPIAEETMFRGALHAGTRAAAGPVLSTLIVSFIFAAIHPQGWTAIPVLMSIAIMFTLLREWRGSLIAPITAHAINNGVVIVFLVLVAG